MIKRVIVKNGVKYIVNTVGWSEDVGPTGPAGSLFMQSITDGLWYAVSLTGTSASAIVFVNKTPLPWQSSGQDFGYQFVYNNIDGKTYQVYLSGSAASVSVKVNPTAVVNPPNAKPLLWLASNTDMSFYNVYLSGSPNPALSVDQNSKWLSIQPGISPFVTGSWNAPYSIYH